MHYLSNSALHKGMDLMQTQFLPIEGNSPLQNAAWAFRTLLNNSCGFFFIIFNTIIFKDFRTVRLKIVQCSGDLDPSTKMFSCWLNFCSVYFKSIITLNPSISSQSCCLIDCHILTGQVPSGLERVNQLSTGSRGLPVSPEFYQHHQDPPENMKFLSPSCSHSALQKLTTLTEVSKAHTKAHTLCSYSKHPTSHIINTEQLHHTACCKALIIEYHKSAQSHAQHLWFYVCSLVSSTIACGTSRICRFLPAVIISAYFIPLRKIK